MIGRMISISAPMGENGHVVALCRNVSGPVRPAVVHVLHARVFASLPSSLGAATAAGAPTSTSMAVMGPTFCFENFGAVGREAGSMSGIGAAIGPLWVLARFDAAAAAAPDAVSAAVPAEVAALLPPANVGTGSSFGAPPATSALTGLGKAGAATTGVGADAGAGAGAAAAAAAGGPTLPTGGRPV